MAKWALTVPKDELKVDALKQLDAYTQQKMAAIQPPEPPPQPYPGDQSSLPPDTGAVSPDQGAGGDLLPSPAPSRPSSLDAMVQQQPDPPMVPSNGPPEQPGAPRPSSLDAMVQQGKPQTDLARFDDYANGKIAALAQPEPKDDLAKFDQYAQDRYGVSPNAEAKQTQGEAQPAEQSAPFQPPAPDLPPMGFLGSRSLPYIPNKPTRDTEERAQKIAHGEPLTGQDFVSSFTDAAGNQASTSPAAMEGMVPGSQITTSEDDLGRAFAQGLTERGGPGGAGGGMLRAAGNVGQTGAGLLESAPPRQKAAILNSQIASLDRDIANARAVKQNPAPWRDSVSALSQDESELMGKKLELQQQLRDLDGELNPTTDRYYHGTSDVFERPEPDKFKENGLYGPGYYMTSASDVAASGDFDRPGYGETRTAGFGNEFSYARGLDELAAAKRTLNHTLSQGEDASPSYLRSVQAKVREIESRLNRATRGGTNVRPIDVPQNLNLFDVDAPANEADVGHIRSALTQLGERAGVGNELARRFDGGLNVADDPSAPSNQHVYDALASTMRHAFPDASPLQVTNQALGTMGYDGVKYAGGKRIPMRDATGQPIEHTALAIFPQSLGKIKNALTGAPGGQTEAGLAVDAAGATGGGLAGYATAEPQQPDESDAAYALRVGSRVGAGAATGLAASLMLTPEGREIARAFGARAKQAGIVPGLSLEEMPDRRDFARYMEYKQGEAARARGRGEAPRPKRTGDDTSMRGYEEWLAQQEEKARADAAAAELRAVQGDERTAAGRALPGDHETPFGDTPFPPANEPEAMTPGQWAAANAPQREAWDALGAPDRAKQAIADAANAGPRTYEGIVSDAAGTLRQPGDVPGAGAIPTVPEPTRSVRDYLNAADTAVRNYGLGILGNPASVAGIAVKNAMELPQRLISGAIAATAGGRPLDTVSQAADLGAAFGKALPRFWDGMTQPLDRGAERMGFGGVSEHSPVRIPVASAVGDFMANFVRTHVGITNAISQGASDMEFGRLARLSASQKGLTGEAFAEDVGETLREAQAIRKLLDNRPPSARALDDLEQQFSGVGVDIAKRGLEAGARSTYTEPLGPFASAFQQGLKKFPVGGQVIAPFTHIPSNVAARTLEASPFGVIGTLIDLTRGKYAGASAGERLQGLGPALSPGVSPLNERAARNAVGAGLVLTGYTLAQNGTIHDDSITIAGKDVPLYTLGIPGMSMAAGAKIADAVERGRGVPVGLAAAAWALIKDSPAKTGALLGRYAMRPELLQALGDYGDPNAGEHFVESQAERWLPAGGAIRFLGNATDSSERQITGDSLAEKTLHAVESVTPGLRNQLPVKRDQAGQPLENPHYGLNALNPFAARQREDDPTLETLKDFGLRPSAQPARVSVDGTALTLTDAEKQTYAEDYQRRVAAAVAKAQASPSWEGRSPAQQRDILRPQLAAAAAGAEGAVLKAMDPAERSRRLAEARNATTAKKQTVVRSR